MHCCVQDHHALDIEQGKGIDAASSSERASNGGSGFGLMSGIGAGAVQRINENKCVIS